MLLLTIISLVIMFALLVPVVNFVITDIKSKRARALQHKQLLENIYFGDAQFKAEQKEEANMLSQIKRLQQLA